MRRQRPVVKDGLNSLPMKKQTKTNSSVVLTSPAAVVSPSSAVEKTVVLICSGLRYLDPGFLHYIFDCILNDSALLGQMQTQPLQQFSHQSLGSRHGA